MLVRNRSFLSFLGTQALGAFNDNVFKQLVLLLGVGFLMAGVEYQAVVQFLFALPFLLFSGLAGDLADRYRPLHYEVHGIEGNALMQGVLDEERNIIFIDHLPAGTYTLSLFGEERLVGRRTFIKQ